MVEETAEQKLKRHEDALIACMAEITKLREENARLRSSENSAHAVLREVYNDPTASPAVRVKAAGLALSHESAPLKPVSQLELKAEEPVIPLADLVRRRRARVKALEGLPPDHPRYLEWVNRDAEDFTDSAGNSSAVGNGQDDDTASG
jgi:hypothetical protein